MELKDIDYTSYGTYATVTIGAAVTTVVTEEGSKMGSSCFVDAAFFAVHDGHIFVAGIGIVEIAGLVGLAATLYKIYSDYKKDKKK